MTEPPTIAHSNNLHGYGAPDLAQAVHVGSGTTIIPHAVGRQATPPLCVEPANLSRGTGGLAVDVSRITPAASRLAWEQACQLADDPQERSLRAHQLLEQMQKHGSTAFPENPMTARIPTIPPAAVSTPVSVSQTPVDPLTASSVPQPASGGSDAIIAALQQTVQMLQQQLAWQQQQFMQAAAAPPPPVERRAEGLPPLPRGSLMTEADNDEPGEIAPPTYPAAERTAPAEMISKDRAVQVVKEGFDSLQIPELGPVATKPRFRVEFNVEGFGRTRAHYHWVGEHNGCLFLVYDTRFEHGMLYEPPILEEGRTMDVTIFSRDGQKTYCVVSQELVHPFGAFYIINLPIAVSSKGSPLLQNPTQFSSEEPDPWKSEA